MGSMKVHQLARGFWEHEPSLTLGCKRLRPLAPKLANTDHSVTSFDLKSFIRPDSGPRKLASSDEKKDSPQGETHPGGTRWNPTQEQIGILEMLYRGGMRTPNGQQIEDITAQLSRYGKIEGKNVFYWFQNHKARERQKQKRNSLGLSHSPRTPSPITIISLDTRGEVEKDEDSPYKRKCKSCEICHLSAPASLGTKILPPAGSVDEKYTTKGAKAIAINCGLVGGGTDGSLDLCARVCLVDEDENIIFHTYVQPQSAVTDYRYEITGLTEEHLRNSKSHKEVQDRILEILYNGESARRVMSDSGKARLLVGHDLKRGLDCLRINYPGHLLRDTAKYRPLLKTNLVSHSLKYLTKTYLGYDIQTGEHDPYVDCVSAMRLYKRMRAQDHQVKGIGTPNSDSGFESQKAEELENMTPDELYQISKSDYKCWCLDSSTAAGLSS